MQPLAIHHVSINVADIDASIDFYTDVLGFTVRSDRPDFGFGGAWLDVGGQQVHLLQAGVPPVLGQHFAVQVDDVDAVITEIRARGIEVSDASPVGGNLQAFLSDPSGNGIELHQVGGASS